MYTKYLKRHWLLKYRFYYINRKMSKSLEGNRLNCFRLYSVLKLSSTIYMYYPSMRKIFSLQKFSSLVIHSLFLFFFYQIIIWLYFYYFLKMVWVFWRKKKKKKEKKKSRLFCNSWSQRIYIWLKNFKTTTTMYSNSFTMNYLIPYIL